MLSSGTCCNKEDAVKARDSAIKNMEDKDFADARKVLLGAQKIFPELESVPQLLAICDVHCAAEARVNKKMDWYAILQIEVAVDGTVIRKQYLKLTRLLHTDKNRFVGAEDAFKLIHEAYCALGDPKKRKRYDVITDRNVFWTSCPSCQTRYKYYMDILNTSVSCQKCKTKFVAADLKVQVMPTSSSVAWGSNSPANVFSNQKYDAPSHQGHRVNPSFAGDSAAEKFLSSTLQQDKSSVLTESENMHRESMTDRADPNIVKPNVNVTENAWGELQFSAVEQDTFSVVTETREVHGRQLVGTAASNIFDTNKLGIEDAYAGPGAPNFPRSRKYSSAGGKSSGQSDVNAMPGNEACSSEPDGQKDDRSDITQNTDERFMPDPAGLNIVGLRKLVIDEASTRPRVNVLPDNEGFCSEHGGEKDDRSEIILGAVTTSMRNKNTGERLMPDPASTRPSVVRYYRRRSGTRKKQDAELSPSSGRKKRQRKNDLPSAHVDSNCKEIIFGDVTNVDRQSTRTLVSSKVSIQEKTEATDISKDVSSGQDASMHRNADRFVFVDSSDPDRISSSTIHVYPDPEFHKFEEDRLCNKFERGQVWALYDDVDAFPKLYGWISKVELEPFVVHLIWLEACSQQAKQMSVSCGRFRILNQRARFDTTETFSHLVLDARGTSIQRQVEILPQVGEIWAIYPPDLDPVSLNACKFAIGEIIEHTEASTKLSSLSKVDGYVAVFKPDTGILEVPTTERLRFSHRIPCFRLTEERGGKLRGFYELDPASLPHVYDLQIGACLCGT